MRKIVSMGQYLMDKELLGKGNFARVELATHKLTCCKIAIKIIDTRKLETAYLSQNLYREARILSKIRHPHIVRLYETLKASYYYCLVIEYVPGGSLTEHLKTLPENRMVEREAWPFIRQITSALYYLHLKGIVHRDLKMDNILLDEQKRNVKIVDFGLSNIYTPGTLLKTHCGSPEYAAPELFHDRHDYGPEVDAWSFGVIIYGMLVGSLPFTPGSTEPSKRRALLNLLNKGLTQSHTVMMNHLSIDCRSLLLQLIEPKPELRMPLIEVIEHAWITKAGAQPIGVNIEPAIDLDLKEKVEKKLMYLNSVDFETLENTVSSFNYDYLSAQYNMLMDKYTLLRKEQLDKLNNLTSPPSIAKPFVRVKPAIPVPPPRRPTIQKRTGITFKKAAKAVMMGISKDDTYIANKNTRNIIGTVARDISPVKDNPAILINDVQTVSVSSSSSEDSVFEKKDGNSCGSTADSVTTSTSQLLSNTPSTQEFSLIKLSNTSDSIVKIKAEALVHQTDEEHTSLLKKSILRGKRLSTTSEKLDVRLAATKVISDWLIKPRSSVDQSADDSTTKTIEDRCANFPRGGTSYKFVED